MLSACFQALYASGILFRTLLDMASGIPAADDIATMTDTELKVLENRLRRAAKRRGLVLVKSRSRDSSAVDYGGYTLSKAGTGAIAAGELGSRGALSLVEVAKVLLETTSNATTTLFDEVETYSGRMLETE